MLQEAIELQNRAVAELVKLAHGSKKNLTFSAPTGSGKTRMMADFMNRILEENDNVVFLVSTLSKSGLPQQSYETFMKCRNEGATMLEPFLITSDTSGEGEPYIPTEDYNVYILPTNLYRNGAILKDRGIFQQFLETMTYNFMGEGKGKQIYLIRDEGHVATNNLDENKKYFEKVFNFSATATKPYDVEISEEQAIQAKLIKDVRYEKDPSYTLDMVLDEFERMRDDYIREVKVHPCLIIQISNADKAEEQMEKIVMPALNNHQSIQWMSIVDTYKRNGEEDDRKQKFFDTNHKIKNTLPRSMWRDEVRKNLCTIDVVIFKMVISEGWDIPRACWLYQVRETTSERLDKQVVGRVRRNPRLLDFERLSDDGKKKASEAKIWGVENKNDGSVSTPVCLWKVGRLDVSENMRIRTTRLETLNEKGGFKVEDFMGSRKGVEKRTDIFTLYKKLRNADGGLADLCYKYASNNAMRWWNVMEYYDSLKRIYKEQILNYKESMVIDKETSLPAASLYQKTTNNRGIPNWLWLHKDEEDGNRFSFDSYAEKEWATFLTDYCEDFCSVLKATNGEEKYLWGKNYPYDSDIHYEYYLEGIHKSYPDFVMKDKKGRIHIFEVKSLDGDDNANFDIEEYVKKIEALKECYLHSSRLLPDHYFYIPILENDVWNIFNYHNGVEGRPLKKAELQRKLRDMNE